MSAESTFTRHFVTVTRAGAAQQVVQFDPPNITPANIGAVVESLRAEPGVIDATATSATVRRRVSEGSFALVAFRRKDDANNLRAFLDNDVEDSCIFVRGGDVPVVTEEVVADDGEPEDIDEGVDCGALTAEVVSVLVTRLKELAEVAGKDHPAYLRGIAALSEASDALLMNERQQRYVRGGGLSCPCCGAGSASVSCMEPDARHPGIFEAEASCGSCKATWVAIHTLAGYRRLRDANGLHVDPDDLD